MSDVSANNSTGRPSYGFVEMLVNGTWVAICGNNWDIDDAQVVCRQLGEGIYNYFDWCIAISNIGTLIICAKCETMHPVCPYEWLQVPNLTIVRCSYILS